MRKLCLVAAISWRMAEACSCGPPQPICTRIDKSGVLFVGDILSSSDDHTGTFAQFTLERVRVVETFKGLPEGAKEVWVNPGSGTSCYDELPMGKRYLIDGVSVGKLAPNIRELSRNYRGERKPLPEGFDPVTALVVLTMGCSNSGPVDARNEDLQFLRAYKAGRWTPRVTGIVSQLSWRSAFIQPDLPVAQALVRLSGADGIRESGTDANGRFEFPGVAPGAYQVSAGKPGYTFPGSSDLTVPPGGCGWWRAEAKSNGKISLRVVSESGAPVANVPVTLLYEAGGKLTTLVTKGSQDTNASGFIELSGLAAATYVISVNPEGPDGTEAPYPATYFPNVREASQATRVRLGPSEVKQGLTMILPQPLPIRQVRVRVIGADGKPVQSATVFSKYSRTAHTDANGVAMLTTFQGFEDTVSAWKEFDTEGENGRSKPWIDWKRWHATAPVQDAGTIQLRFEKWKRNGDRK